MYQVLKHLDDARAVASVMGVCRALYRLCRTSTVWARLANSPSHAWNVDWYGKLWREQFRSARRVVDKAVLVEEEEERNVGRDYTRGCRGPTGLRRARLPSLLTAGDVNAGARPSAIVVDCGGFSTKAGTLL
jgi:hypothetical protein